MQSQERLPLQVEQTAQIYRLIDPNFQGRKKQLVTAIGDWGMARRHFLNLLEEGSRTLDPILEDIAYSEAQLSQADQNLQATEGFIYHPQSSFRGQGKALLGRWISGILRKDHPYVTSIKEEKQAVQAFLDQKRQEQVEKEATLQRQAPLLRSADGERITAEARLLSVFESIVVGDWDLSQGYVGILPYRAHPLAERFGDTFYLDPTKIEDFEGLRELINPYVQARARVKAYRALTDPKISLKDIPAEELPGPIKDAIKAWVTYEFENRLYSAGLIPEQPVLTNILKS